MRTLDWQQRYRRTRRDSQIQMPKQRSLTTRLDTHSSPLSATPSIDRALFKHAALNKEAKEIRVLEILPKLSPDGLIQCHCRILRLLPATFNAESTASSPSAPFKALSYEWGSPGGVSHTILIDRKIFKVRRNLHDFLLAYRNRHSRRPSRLPLWIDAISIDQGNVTERNHQLSLMKEIYTQADCVIVWLGQRFCSFTLVALGLFATIAQIHFWMYYDIPPLLSASLACITNVLQSVGMDSVATAREKLLVRMRQSSYRSMQHTWRSLGKVGPVDLESASYFDRCFIQGELSLARRKQVFLAELCLPWHLARRVVRLGSEVASSYCPPAVDSSDFPPTYLERNLILYRHTRCDLPHDRVYALLAMSKFGAHYPVDYDQTLAQLLLQTSLFCVQAHFREPGHPNFCHSVLRFLLVQASIDCLAVDLQLGSNINVDGVREIMSVSQAPPATTFQVRCYTSMEPDFAEIMEADQLDKEFFSSTLAEMHRPAPVHSVFGGLVRCVSSAVEATRSTHVLTIRYINDGSVLLLFLRTVKTERDYCITARVRLLPRMNGSPRVYVDVETYGEYGLPSTTVYHNPDPPISEEPYRTQTSILQCHDLKSLVILFGLPNDLPIRRAVIGCFHDQESFPLETITYNTFEVGWRGEGIFENIATTVWTPP